MFLVRKGEGKPQHPLWFFFCQECYFDRKVKQLHTTESCGSSISTFLARQWNDLLYWHCVTLQEILGAFSPSSAPNSVSAGICEDATNVFSLVYVSQYVSSDVLLTSIVFASQQWSILYMQSVAWHVKDFIFNHPFVQSYRTCFLRGSRLRLSADWLVCCLTCRYRFCRDGHRIQQYSELFGSLSYSYGVSLYKVVFFIMAIFF